MTQRGPNKNFARRGLKWRERDDKNLLWNGPIIGFKEVSNRLGRSEEAGWMRLLWLRRNNPEFIEENEPWPGACRPTQQRDEEWHAQQRRFRDREKWY